MPVVDKPKVTFADDIISKYRLFTTPETAEILGLSPATLEIWRSEGGHGLQYLKLAGGAVRYTLESIQNFIDRSKIPLKGGK